jgi:predicted transposase/invertase (TIGR01784 family)
MSDLSNPHDRFFKEVFSQPEMMQDFLQSYLPAEIVAALDLSALTLEKDSFVDPDLQQHFSDLLYRAHAATDKAATDKEVYIYLLFEHKSYPDAMTPLQILGYVVRIWEHLQRPDRLLFLPPILPLVIYHGRRAWRIPVDFGALFTGPESLRPFHPAFQYMLFDLSAYSDDEIRGAVIMQATLLVMKHIFDPGLAERLPEILKLLRELTRQETGLQYLYTLLRYVSQGSNNISVTAIRQAVKTAFSMQGGDFMGTAAQEWIEEGRYWVCNKVCNKVCNRVCNKVCNKVCNRVCNKEPGKE